MFQKGVCVCVSIKPCGYARWMVSTILLHTHRSVLTCMLTLTKVHSFTSSYHSHSGVRTGAQGTLYLLGMSGRKNSQQ